MNAPLQLLHPRRAAVRRAVRMECAVLSASWDGAAPLLATDLSPFGMWLDTPLALDVGEELVVRFRPPGWPGWGWPVTSLAEVVRVSLSRRRNDWAPPGMGLRFVDLDAEERARLTELLRGLPPPLPGQPRADALMVVDGLRFELRAEGALLTGGRPLVAPLALPAALPSPRLSRAKHRVRRRALRPTSTRAPGRVLTLARRVRLKLVG